MEGALIEEDDSRSDSEAPRTPKTICCGACTEDDSEELGCVAGPLLLSVLIVVCGTASTITSKLQYEVRSRGFEHCHYEDRTTRRCPFTKPYFQTLVMKAAMSTCLLIAWVAKRCRRPQPTGELAEALLDNEAPRQTPDRSAILAVAAPAFTDLLQTALAQAGLLFVSSSTYQMTRGSVVVFTCILSVRWLKQKLRPHHYVAVAVVCAAVALVGVAGRFGEKGHASLGSYVLGLGLIVIGQAVGALQFCLEEHLMTQRGLSPVVLVGWEGLWGILYFVILAPVLSLTPDSNVAAAALWHEDFAETFDQLAHSGDLIALTLASALALLLYNLVGNMVTKQLSAVMRSILESCRTLGVWLTSLVLYYAFHDSRAGERWTGWSFLELLGFALLVYGTLAYKELVPVPLPRPESPLPIDRQRSHTI